MKAQQKASIMHAYHKDARYWYDQGDEYRMWRSLLLAAEVNWTSNTERQREQRRLAVELRVITGCIGNLRALRTGNFDVCRAIDDLRKVEQHVRVLMATIKERIPA